VVKILLFNEIDVIGGCVVCILVFNEFIFISSHNQLIYFIYRQEALPVTVIFLIVMMSSCWMFLKWAI